MKTKILKSYLDSVKDKTIKEIKLELNSKIEDYIKNIRILLIKSNYQIEEYKKISEKIEKENINIKEINLSLVKYNKELKREINNYQSNLASLQKSYELLIKQKDLFEVILNEYSSNSPDQILSELKIAKEGSLQLLKNYNDIVKENSEMKKEIENMEKKYKEKMDILLKGFNDYKDDKINEDKQKRYKIKYLETKLYNSEKYQKDNYNLHQILYYLYNLLFEEFSLNKNVKINEKYLNVKESDFEPNVIFDEEIKNYIKLMIKSMHRESMDVIFRECVGYLNMIIRKYFPNKKNLRFKPVEMLIEINNYIDSKIKEINEDNLLIKQYKNNYLKIQKENIKINKKIKKNIYDSYQFKGENHISLNSQEFNKLQKSFNRNDINNKKSLTNQNIYNTPYNNKVNDIYKINTNIKNNISLYNLKKTKLKLHLNKSEDNKITKKKNTTEERKSLKTLSLFENIEKKDNDILIINKRTRNKSSNIFKSKTMKKNGKIIKENGNSKEMRIYHDYNFLVEETNRLILYKPRMKSYNERKKENLDNKENDVYKENKKNINDIFKNNNNNNIYFQKNKNDKIEKKIFKEINYIISNLKK